MLDAASDLEQLARARGYQVETGIEAWAFYRARVAWIRFGQAGKMVGWGSLTLWGDGVEGRIEKRALKFWKSVVDNLPIRDAAGS